MNYFADQMDESVNVGRTLDARNLNSELELTASRSDGPGGQNVNKVSSKITLRFNVRESVLLSQEEKDRIIAKLGNRLTKEGALLLSSSEHRSQLQNKQEVE